MKANIIPRGIHSTVWSGSTCALLLSFVLVAPLSLPLSRLHAQESEYALSDREIEKGDLVYLDIEHVFSETGERRIISSTNREAIDVEVGYPVWVRNDGSIHLPYLDPMKVAGSKPSQLAPIILKAYQDRASQLGLDLDDSHHIQREDISVYGVRGSPAFLDPDYVARPGDVLAILVDTFLGRPDLPIPISYSSAGSLCPAFGYPIQVAADGTILLPLVDVAVSVNGLSVSQIEEAIWVALTEKKKYLTRFCRVMAAPFWVPPEGTTINDEPLKPGDSIAVEFPQDWDRPDFSPSPIYLPLRGDAPPFTGIPFSIDKDGTLDILGFEVAAAGLTLRDLSQVARDNWRKHASLRDGDYPMWRLSRISDSIERRLSDPSTLIQPGQLLCLAGLPESKDLPARSFHFPKDPRFGPAYGVRIPVDLDGRIRLAGIGLIEAHQLTCRKLSEKIIETYRQRVEDAPSFEPQWFYPEVRIVGGASK